VERNGAAVNARNICVFDGFGSVFFQFWFVFFFNFDLSEFAGEFAVEARADW